ncbi:sulfotransferase [Patescibacteria group bacterium]|nr:sulfotransferase [Patescibacteria group bacterium]
MNNDFKLDFVGIGAPRSGTTWISRCLDEHPQICFSKTKEFHFFMFDKRYQRGLNYLKKQFTHCQPNTIKGEWSVDYLYSEEVAQRIKKDFPDTKILICLRDPVERAHNHFLFQKQNSNIGHHHNFKDIILPNDKYKYLERGFYAKYIKKYLEFFPRENIYIMFFEDIKEKPLELIQSLYQFLGVDKNFIPSNLNKKSDYRDPDKFYSIFIQNIINKIIYLYKKSFLRKPLQILQFKKIMRFFAQLNTRNPEQKFGRLKTVDDSQNIIDKSLEKELKEKLLNDIEELEKMTGRNLTSWKN